MTKRYTAADFANAKFAEHPDGRTAMKSSGHTRWDVKFLDGHISTRGDYHMASFDWVPVPTKPSITESRFMELVEVCSFDDGPASYREFCRLAGIEIIPDPEPANTDRLEEILEEVWAPIESARTLAEWLDSNGVTAPNVKGN